MTMNVKCAGNQDRATEASETHPNRPPTKTRNCYKTDDFEWSECGKPGEDKACAGVGGESACTPDSYGGYCSNNGKVYIAFGSTFKELSSDDLLKRTRDDGNRDELRLRRSQRDMERKMNNRIREMQIMGRDPFPNRDKTSTKDDSSPQNFIGNYLIIITLGLGLLLIISSYGIEYAKKKKIFKTKKINSL